MVKLKRAVSSVVINEFNVKQYLDFLWAMTEREFKARYKRAVFGFLWVVLNPLLQMFIIGIIFSFFIKIPNYFLFLFTGLLPWTFFSLSISKTTSSFVFERSLLQKAKFPKEAIPLSIIFSSFLHLLISLVLFIAFLGVTGKLKFPSILLMTPALAWLLAFTIGCSLFTSTLQVKYRDINFFVQTLLTLWFYASPVLYSLQLIPSSLRPMFALNPLASILELFHLAVLGQGILNFQMIAINLAISIVVLWLGIVTYKRQHKYFVDWL